MKEHFQDYGVRKWAGDDLIELQSEPLAALQALVSPYAPCIISGCKVKDDDEGGYTVSAGLVALAGKDVKGEDCVKIVRAAGITMADNNQVCYLTLQHQTLTRTYRDGTSKAIVYDYTAQQSTIKPEDAPYLEISVDGGRRLVDALEITQKLDREGGEAKDVKVTFADPLPGQEPETLKSNAKLGTLISQIKGWLSALKALAFKEKVAKDDLDADLTKELNDKVDKVNGKVLSTNDFTDALKKKLDDIDENANNYTHPPYTQRTGNTGNMTPGFGGTAYTYTYDVDNQGHVTGQNSRTIKIPDTPASTTTAGLMSADDKSKLDGIAKNANNFTYTHPTSEGNKHIPTGGESGQYLKWSAKGTAIWAKPTASDCGAAASGHAHAWGEITGKPSTFTPSTHDHAWGNITGKPSSFTPSSHSHDAATASTDGFMSATDKKKLDEIPVTISVKGDTLTFTWIT
ncbi:MAG: hypothetical protein K2O53_03160, partial [Bacteroidales bacterium]|nr:hypothetical protein [Bacteroidales bacterium]